MTFANGKRPIRQLAGHELEVLMPQVVSPLYNSRVADELVSGGVPILMEISSSRGECAWHPLANLRPDEPMVCPTKERLVKTVRSDGVRWLAPPGAELESVWMLLGYLIEAGPLPVAICAPKPVILEKVRYIAFWGRIGGLYPDWGLRLIRHDTHFPENYARFRRAQLLVSEPID